MSLFSCFLMFVIMQRLQNFFYFFLEVNASNHLTVYWHVYRSLMWVNGHIDMQVNKYVYLVLN